MNANSKIYVAGNTGLVGSAIVRMLHWRGYTNILSSPSSHWDLRRQEEVETFFRINQPEYVYLAAAKVGGIGANSDCLLYTSPSPRDLSTSRMPSSA